MNNQQVNDFIQANGHLTDREIANALVTLDADLQATPDSVRGRRRRMGQPKNRSNMSVIEELLKKSGIDPAEINRVEKVRINTYQSLTKDSDGEAQIHDLEAASLVLTPKWAEGPEWPLVQPVNASDHQAAGE